MFYLPIACCSSRMSAAPSTHSMDVFIEKQNPTASVMRVISCSVLAQNFSRSTALIPAVCQRPLRVAEASHCWAGNIWCLSTWMHFLIDFPQLGEVSRTADVIAGSKTVRNRLDRLCRVPCPAVMHLTTSPSHSCRALGPPILPRALPQPQHGVPGPSFSVRSLFLRGTRRDAVSGWTQWGPQWLRGAS